MVFKKQNKKKTQIRQSTVITVYANGQIAWSGSSVNGET